MVGQQFNPDRSLLASAPARTSDSNAETGRSMNGDQPLFLEKPLAVILSSSGQDSVTAGSVFSVSVTISNKGHQSAVIDVAIEAVSAIVRQWCTTGLEQVALGPGHSDEVVFQFRVPVDVLPGTYYYCVVVEAQEHYPEDIPLRYEQAIHVLPTIQGAVRSSDPTFMLQPTTTSSQPALIQPGGALQVQVLVHNRSDRVDRFRLVCTDLPKSWFSLTYPQGVQGSGILVEADSLNLNPGEHGQILLLLNPPVGAIAGSYVPTLRLYSENNPELMLLDLVYLQVPPIYLLQAELRTIINRVRRQAGIFQVRLTNVGNTRREVYLRVRNLDEDNLCIHTLARSQVVLVPKEIIGVDVQVQPYPWWRRPVYGGGRILNFCIELEDARSLPLPTDNLPGVLVWEARPWWQFLPFLLLGLVGLLLLAYLIWWWLIRVPPAPTIAQFDPEDSTYTAMNGDVVRLSWQIDHPSRLQSIKLVGLSATDGAALTRPEMYDFSHGVPSVLQPFCTQQQDELTCRSVRTSARKPGSYVFEITTAAKPGRGAASDTRKTAPVTIVPIPQAQIVAFASTQPVYQEASPVAIQARPITTITSPPLRSRAHAAQPGVQPTGIQLNWAIAYPDQLQALQLIGRSPDGAVVSPLKRYDFRQGIPTELKSSCTMQEQLICQRVNTNAVKPGDYVFELVATSKTPADAKPISQKTEVIKIVPRPPQILEFSLNGQPAQPKYLIPIVAGQSVPQIVLSWRVDASDGTKVELLPAPGTVALQGRVPIIVSPKPGSVTVTLQVTSLTGQQLTRSVTLETFDPTVSDPAATAAAAAAAAIANAQKPAASPPATPPSVTDPTPSAPGALSPLELPPQLDRH